MPTDRPQPRTPDPEEGARPGDDGPNTSTKRVNEQDEQRAREEAGVPEGRKARKAPRPVEPGALPQGREEERRGHALPTPPGTDADDPATGAPLGRDEEHLHGVHDT